MKKCKVLSCKEREDFGSGYCRKHHEEMKRISLDNFEKEQEKNEKDKY